MRKKLFRQALTMLAVVALLIGLISFSMVDQLYERIIRIGEAMSVNLKCLNEGRIGLGDTVQLYATVTGINREYTLEWQYYDRDTGWHVLKEAEGTFYSYVVDEENIGYTYRVVAYIDADPVMEEVLRHYYGDDAGMNIR